MPLPEMKVEYGGPDKVVILPQPRLQPAKCILCGAPGDGRPFVDIGCYLDWYGAVYFCGYCIVSISNKLGYYSPSQWETLNQSYRAALSENHILADANEKLRSILSNVLDLSSDECSDFVLLFHEFEEWLESDQGPKRNDPEKGADDSGVTEQIVEQRSNDVSNDGDSGQLEFDFEQ